MKKILYIISALLLIAACGEKNAEPTPGPAPELTLEEKLCGAWHSTQLPITADIYIEFSSDNTFQLYQQVGEGAYYLYRGTWNLEDTLLTGKYNDEVPWASAYTIEINNKTLTLISNNTAAEVSTYEKTSVPSEIKETCVVAVKSR